MFEFRFNCNAPALGVDVGFSFGARQERRTPKIDLGGSPVAVIHGLHSSRHADIYERWRLRVSCASALLLNSVGGLQTKKAQNCRVQKFDHASSILSRVN